MLVDSRQVQSRYARVDLRCNGSYVFAPGVKSFQETPKVEVADTVGAGDSFTGTFCASILKGKSITEAHELAVKVSAYVCTQNGAMPIIPEEYTK